MIFGSEPDAPAQEEFGDYDSYFNTDMWPSAKDATWVGDMAPQHAASAIYKLRRWAIGQWADEMRGEQEWEKCKTTRLYRYLAARATANDFVEAAADEPQFMALGAPAGTILPPGHYEGVLMPRDATVAILRALMPMLDLSTFTDASAEQLAGMATAVGTHLYETQHLVLVKGQP